MKINFSPTKFPTIVKTQEPEENTSGPKWVSHEEAFKMLDLGDRYRMANGKKYHSYAWLNYLKKLNGTHHFDNVNRAHVRRLAKKKYQVLVQKIEFQMIYPKFIRSDKYKMAA